ncbi:prepilin peptidase [Bacillus pacificus]
MVIAMRVPLGESIITPRSYCHYCKYVAKAKRIDSNHFFCIQRGRCTNCKRKISILYVVFELITGMICLLTVYMIGVERELIIVLSLFFVTSYYFSYRLHIYVNSKSYFSLVCLFTHFRMCFLYR